MNGISEFYIWYCFFWGFGMSFLFGLVIGMIWRTFRKITG